MISWKIIQTKYYYKLNMNKYWVPLKYNIILNFQQKQWIIISGRKQIIFWCLLFSSMVIQAPLCTINMYYYLIQNIF